MARYLHCLILLFALFSWGVAQLERCSTPDGCPREGEVCLTVGDDLASLRPCPFTEGSFCFCAPEDPNDLVSCGRGADCEEGQRCGRPSNSDDFICVSCDSIPVEAVGENRCARPSTSVTSTPSVSFVPTATEPDVPPTVTPPPGPSESDGMGDDDDIDDDDDDGLGGDAPASKEPTPEPIPTPSHSVSISPTPSLSFGASPSITATSSVSPSVTPSITASATVSLSFRASPSIPSTVSPTLSSGASPTPFASESPEEAEPSPEDDPICVDAGALAEFSSDQLVFPAHRRAAVLCDVSGSCATPGHIVHYKGYAMMMRSYCDIVGSCSRAVKMVNSPKFRRALRVSSKTDGLAYTAFAARYETRAEEHVLKRLVHMGL